MSPLAELYISYAEILLQLYLYFHRACGHMHEIQQYGNHLKNNDCQTHIRKIHMFIKQRSSQTDFLFFFSKITDCLDKGNALAHIFWTSIKHVIQCLFKNYQSAEKKLERLTDQLIRKWQVSNSNESSLRLSHKANFISYFH